MQHNGILWKAFVDSIDTSSLALNKAPIGGTLYMVSPFGDEIREFQVVMPHWDFTSRPAGWVGWWGRGMTWQYTANRFSPTLWSYFEQIMLTAFQFSFFIKLQKVHGSSCRPGAQRPDIYGNTRMKHIESHRMMTVVEGGTPSTGFHLQGENLEGKKFDGCHYI